jgi:hypothetical protein
LHTLTTDRAILWLVSPNLHHGHKSQQIASLPHISSLMVPTKAPIRRVAPPLSPARTTHSRAGSP